VTPPDQPLGARASGARTRFRRRSDYLALGLIVVVVLGLTALVWGTSDVGATVSQTAPSAGASVPAEPDAVPGRLREVWRAPSGATPRPVVAGSSVVTGDGGTVTGRDPLTGKWRWRYTRDIPLCTVAVEWSKVLTVYHKYGGLLPSDAQQAHGNCSEVTALNSTTGARKEQRNGNAELGTRLVTDGNYVTTTGSRLLDTWRSDLVQTSEYGKVPDTRNPGRQPRSGCTYGSVTEGGDNIGVIERCPGDATDRLTVYSAVNPDDDEADRPDVKYTLELPGKRARVVAMTDDAVAVALPDPSRLLIYATSEDKQLASYPLDVPATDLNTDPPGHLVPVVRGSVAMYWYTGSSTVALDPDDFRPLWTIKDTIGPAVEFAGRTLLPTPAGLAVLDMDTGQRLRDIPVDRGGYRGPVEPATIGPVVLEQRGAKLVALR
jgi:hypothetical protein